MLGVRHAVLIANNVFPNESRLQTLTSPEKDVDGLAAVLRSPDRGCFNDVTVLKNRPHHEIASNIHRALKKTGKEDLVVVYYSGHGKLNQSGQLYLAANDTSLDELESSAIAVGRIRDFVEVSQSRQVVIILDCCFSGAIGGVFSKSTIEDQLKVEASKGRGTYIMTASTGIQTALEKETDQYSVFTKHLIAGIETGEADINRNGVITLEELYDYLYPRVREESHQEPTRWNVDTRGHLVIANSGRQPRKACEKALQDLLLDLFREGQISNEFLAVSLALIGRSTESLSPTDQACYVLLNELHNGKINQESFLLKWVQIRSVKANKSAGKNKKARSETTSQSIKSDPKSESIQIEETQSSSSPNILQQAKINRMPESPLPESKGSAQTSTAEATAPRQHLPKVESGNDRRHLPIAYPIGATLIIVLVYVFAVRPWTPEELSFVPDPTTTNRTKTDSIPEPIMDKQTDPESVQRNVTSTTKLEPQPVDQRDKKDHHKEPNSDATKATDRYQKSAERGNSNAQYQLGLIYYEGGKGVPKNENKALEWFRKSAEQGNAEAQYKLGWMYSLSDDLEKATEWYYKAAEQGHADAQYQLGKGYYFGPPHGLQKDEEKAEKWLGMSAEQGNTNAQYMLSGLYGGYAIRSGGSPQYEAKRSEWLQKASDNGHSAASSVLAEEYAEGKYVPQDKGKAISYILKSAEQGHARAQFKVGELYLNGIGVPQDDAKAVEWFQKSAKKGDAAGKYRLGWMYKNGLGVPKNANKAAEWYQKAGEHGESSFALEQKRFIDKLK